MQLQRKFRNQNCVSCYRKFYSPLLLQKQRKKEKLNSTTTYQYHALKSLIKQSRISARNLNSMNFFDCSICFCLLLIGSVTFSYIQSLFSNLCLSIVPGSTWETRSIRDQIQASFLENMSSSPLNNLSKLMEAILNYHSPFKQYLALNFAIKLDHLLFTEFTENSPTVKLILYQKAQKPKC